MKPEKNNFKITKINLASFLTLLESVYANGADYIDLYADIDKKDKQDTIVVSTPESYFNEDARNNFVEEEQEDDDKIEEENIIDPIHEGYSEEYINMLLKNL